MVLLVISRKKMLPLGPATTGSTKPLEFACSLKTTLLKESRPSTLTAVRRAASPISKTWTVSATLSQYSYCMRNQGQKLRKVPYLACTIGRLNFCSGTPQLHWGFHPRIQSIEYSITNFRQTRKTTKQTYIKVSQNRPKESAEFIGS